MKMIFIFGIGLCVSMSIFGMEPRVSTPAPIEPHHHHHHHQQVVPAATPSQQMPVGYQEASRNSVAINVAMPSSPSAKASPVPSLGAGVLQALYDNKGGIEQEVLLLSQMALDMYVGPHHTIIHDAVTPYLKTHIEALRSSAAEDENKQKALKHLKDYSAERKKAADKAAAASSASEPIASSTPSAPAVNPCFSAEIHAMVMQSIVDQMKAKEEELSKLSLESAQAKQDCRSSARQRNVAAALAILGSVTSAGITYVSTHYAKG